MAYPETGEISTPANIHDVAERAGVSIKTVSRVVNHEANVSEKTRAAVMEAVTALSYRPNVFARGLASERSFLIGLLYDNPSESYVAGLQLGALARCREAGYHLVVEHLDAGDAHIGQAVHSLVTESQLHGVVVTPPLCDVPAVLEALTRARTRFVRISPEKYAPGILTVGIDDHKAAYDMTAYLIGLGHRRIGFIKGHPAHGATHGRFDGYRAALAKAGLPFVEELSVQGYFSYQSGMAAAETLFALKRRPTAIFASNDDMAAAVLAAAQRSGIRTPEELSVAGFDDSLVAQVVWPRLTTCRQPIKEMAAEAVSMLAGKAGDGAVPERRLEHELIIRESTAPPAR
ncbi:MAG: LacI family DNA-binding transcriptional regulator [Rhizomicrobium sp.]